MNILVLVTISFSLQKYFRICHHEIVDLTVVNDSTIEERVAVLEFQVAALTDDTVDLEDSVSIIAVEQVLQDEKILALELNSVGEWLPLQCLN